MSEATPDGGGPGGSDPGELERLRAERDALERELARLRGRRQRQGRVRGGIAIIGVVLTGALVVGAVLGVWARRSFLRTEVFSDRAGNLIDDPGVQAALSGYLAEELNHLIDPQDIFEEALPEQAQILAVPLAGAVEGFVGDQVAAVVASDRFATLWRDAVELAHTQAVRVLTGDTDLIEEHGDRIDINLLPVINEVLARIGDTSPEILGREVDLPTVTVDDVPDAARQAISRALGVPLDENFGTFTIYDQGALSTAQHAVRFADRLVWVLLVLAPLAVAGTLWISHRRRRTLLQLTVGLALSMVLLRRLVLLFQADLLDLVRIDRNRPAVDAASHAFLDPLLSGALWIGWTALAVAAIAALAGPYGWAVRLRRGAVALVQGAVALAGRRSRDEAARAWIGEHRDALRIGGVAVGLVLLWWLDVSWLGFFLLAGLVGAYELVVDRLAARAGEGEPPGPVGGSRARHYGD